MKKIFNKSEYILSIFYKGTKHPTKVERKTVEELRKWLNYKRNHAYLKDCTKWVINNTEGYEVTRGSVSTETVLTISVDE